MRNTCLFILFLTVLFSCKKEEVQYKISISGLSSDSVSIGDTLEVYINWENSVFTENISLNIDGVSQSHLGFKDKTTLLFEIPSSIEDFNCIYINHPNGAQGVWCAFYKIDNPRITNISSLEGTGGDEITISGIDFLSGDSIAVKINAMHCKIVSLSGTSITFTVPNGCGSGKVKLVYWPDYSCTPDRLLEAGLFHYNFPETISNSQVKSYIQDGYKYTIERDNLGRVSKRKVRSKYDDIQLNYTQLFIYGSDGLLDTLKHYSGSNLSYCLVYERNDDNSIVEISNFGRNGDFREKQERHYKDGKLILLNLYVAPNITFSQPFSNKYHYVDDKFRVEWKNMNTGENNSSQTGFNTILDIYNGAFPDIGAPGFIEYDDDLTYPHVANYNNYSTIRYDDYGRLTSWKITQSYCQSQNSSYERIYEYE